MESFNSTTICKSSAKKIDADLMSCPFNYSIDQLMELAGMSVAQAISRSGLICQKVLVVCGPGNNGGDGLVASRHLIQHNIAKNVYILYPKVNKKNLIFQRLIQQAQQENIPIVNTLESLYSIFHFDHAIGDPISIPDFLRLEFDLIVDAIFGFSFENPVHEPFIDIIHSINESKLPVVSVDIPSGWDADHGILDNDNSVRIRNVSVLVSLMAPKHGITKQKEISIGDAEMTSNSKCDCIHFLGFPFMPKALSKKYNIYALPYKHAKGSIIRLKQIETTTEPK